MTQRLNIDIVARDKSKQALSSVKGSLGKLKQSIFNVRNAFIGLGAGLVVRNIINTGKQIESLQVRLKFLFGTAEEGAKAFDAMAKFASKVPFSLEEIQQGAGVLAVVSKDAKEMANMMKITGNVAAVTGLDFRTTAEQIQRAMSAGIGAADLFRDRGVKAMLGFKAGAVVSIEETVAAFERVFGKGGKFDGATDQLAKTFEGTLSMIGDKVFNFKRVLLEAGFFRELKNQFGDLNKFLEDNGKQVDAIAKKIGKGLAIAFRGLANTVIFVKNNIDKFAFALGSLIALKVATFFYGIVTALNALTFAMYAFNLATKKNIIFGSIMVFVTAMGFLIKKFIEFKGELNKQEETIASLNASIVKWQKIVDNTSTRASYKARKNASLNIKIALEKIRLLKLERDELKMTDTAHMRVRTNMSKFITELEKQKKLTKEFMEAFKSNQISKSHNAMHEMMNETIGQSKTLQEVFSEINKKELDNFATKFKEIKTTIAEGISNGIRDFSNSLARAVILGENLAESFKRMAQDLAIKILSITIEIIIRKNIELFLEKRKTDELRKQTRELITQQSLKVGGSMLSFFGLASGGSVSKGRPEIVGERGPELFVPNSSGQIQQNARGTGGGSVNVNFNIDAIDSSSFNNVLVENRGIITSIINNALNEKGRRELV